MHTVLGMPVADEACLVTVGFQDVVEFQDLNSNTVEIPRYEAIESHLFRGLWILHEHGR
jgi:hypothetical protein